MIPSAHIENLSVGFLFNEHECIVPLIRDTSPPVEHVIESSYIDAIQITRKHIQ
jgi:hypothetical protein